MVDTFMVVVMSWLTVCQPFILEMMDGPPTITIIFHLLWPSLGKLLIMRIFTPPLTTPASNLDSARWSVVTWRPDALLITALFLGAAARGVWGDPQPGFL